MNNPILDSIVLDTDGYKPSHWLQYPPDDLDVLLP